MALGDAYLTLVEFKARSRSTTAANDAAITAVLLSASRQIDGFCGREFNKSTAAEARVFDAPWWHDRMPVLELGDVVSLTEIAADDGTGTYPTVWAANAYLLTPRNASLKGRPYSLVVPAPGISLAWPLWPYQYPVRATGIFGWPSVPAPVKEVCFMLANRLKSLWDAPFGLSGGGEMGALDMTVSLTPILKEMLSPYRVLSL